MMGTMAKAILSGMAAVYFTALLFPVTAVLVGATVLLVLLGILSEVDRVRRVRA